MFNIVHGFRYLLGVLEHIPSRWMGTTVISRESPQILTFSSIHLWTWHPNTMLSHLLLEINCPFSSLKANISFWELNPILSQGYHSIKSLPFLFQTSLLIFFSLLDYFYKHTNKMLNPKLQAYTHPSKHMQKHTFYSLHFSIPASASGQPNSWQGPSVI